MKFMAELEKEQSKIILARWPISTWITLTYYEVQAPPDKLAPVTGHWTLDPKIAGSNPTHSRSPLDGNQKIIGLVTQFYIPYRVTTHEP